jgi:hypothetical protein
VAFGQKTWAVADAVAIAVGGATGRGERLSAAGGRVVAHPPTTARLSRIAVTALADVDEDVLDLGIEVQRAHPELAPDA